MKEEIKKTDIDSRENLRLFKGKTTYGCFQMNVNNIINIDYSLLNFNKTKHPLLKKKFNKSC